MIKIVSALKLFLLGILILNGKCENSQYETEILKINKLSNGSYIHVSYIDTDSFGRVSCNGMIFVNNGEAIVVDTPTNQQASKELMFWIETELDAELKKIVVTHFHEDCLGGLNEFHLQGIDSYSNARTIEITKSENKTVPKEGFDSFMELEFGDERLILEYFGEGHTLDNIICYYPKDKMLFGGCLIKALGVGKGYLGDANLKDWPNTVSKIKNKYGSVKITVVPGHGNSGNNDLFDYTINLFKE